MWDSEVPDDVIDVKVQDGWVTLGGDVSYQFESDAAYDDVAGLPRGRGRDQRAQGH